MAGSATLDQLEGRIHLIGAVDGQIDPIHRVEALQGNTELGGQHLALEGGGHTHDVAELTALELGPQGLNHQGRGGAGAQPHHHAAADLLGGCRRHRLLHLILQVRHRSRPNGPRP